MTWCTIRVKKTLVDRILLDESDTCYLNFVFLNCKMLQLVFSTFSLSNDTIQEIKNLKSILEFGILIQKYSGSNLLLYQVSQKKMFLKERYFFMKRNNFFGDTQYIRYSIISKFIIQHKLVQLFNLHTMR